VKVVILAGGFGTRLAELTETIPKPMVPVGGRPILWHIMQHYAKFGHTEFVLALGYKAEVVKDYFLKFNSLNSDFKVNLASGKVEWLSVQAPNWDISLVDTGLDSLTGTRLRLLKELIGNERFMLTYGDGVSNVPIDKLLEHHKISGKMVTMTAVRPTARFGELDIVSGEVKSFKEKPQLHSGWINGGFFICEPEFIDHIPAGNVMLEREPLEAVTQMGQLGAYQHDDFWQCMDTKRDQEVLEALWSSGNPPWLV
jgi:glucose-1-phosphate cytidylyltransferase